MSWSCGICWNVGNLEALGTLACGNLGFSEFGSLGIIGADGIDGIRGKGVVLGVGLVVRALSLVGVLGES